MSAQSPADRDPAVARGYRHAPDGDSPGPEPACEECGYSLRGASAGAAAPVCPECGTRVDPARPWVRRSWDRRAVLARLISPLVIFLAIGLGLSAARVPRNWLIWPFWLIWLVGMAYLIFLWPPSAARRLASERLPRLDRARAARAAWLPAIVVNVVLGVGALLLFFSWLR